MTEAILLAISLALAGVTYHYAFPLSRTRMHLAMIGWLGRLTSAFYSLLVMSLVLAVVVWQEGSAAASLSRHVDPFPVVKDVTWVPPFLGEKTRFWVLTTVLSARSVVQFYRDARHRKGWQVEEAGSNVLILRKNGQCLYITANPDAGPTNGTTILYTLKEDCR